MNYQSYLQIFQSMTFPKYPAPIYRVQDIYGGETLFSKDTGEPQAIKIFGPRRGSHQVLLSILMHEDGHILSDSMRAYRIIGPLLKGIDESRKNDLLNIFEDYRAEKEVSRLYPSLRHILPLHAIQIILQAGHASVMNAVLLLARAAYSPYKIKKKLKKTAKNMIELARGENIADDVLDDAIKQFVTYGSDVFYDPENAAEAIKKLVKIFPELLNRDDTSNSNSDKESEFDDGLKEELEKLSNVIVSDDYIETTRDTVTIEIPRDKSWERVYTSVFGIKNQRVYGKSGTSLDPLSLSTPQPLFEKRTKIRSSNGKREVALLIDFSGSTRTPSTSELMVYELELRGAKAITNLIERQGGKVTWWHFSSHAFLLKKPNAPIPKTIKVEFNGTRLMPALRLAQLQPLDTILVLTDAQLSIKDWEYLKNVKKRQKIAVLDFSGNLAGSKADTSILYRVVSPRTLVIALRALHEKGII